MNRKQWYVLAIVSFLFGSFFIYIDLNNGSLYSFPKELSETGNLCLDSELNSLKVQRDLFNQWNNSEITKEEFENKMDNIETLDKYDVTCILSGEIYEPFIYLFNIFWVVFLILGFLEPKEKIK